MSPNYTGAVRAEADQGATFVELFFDLVFVFAVTQIVGLIHDDRTWSGVGKGLLVFWLIWWAWSQFTWALNPADTEHAGIQAATLAATGVAFLMAYGVSDAFVDGGGFWFAVPYVAVRLIGLGIYLKVAWGEAEQRLAVAPFALQSLVGLSIAVIGGGFDTPIRVWLWLTVIVADLVTAAIGGRSSGWDLRPSHFSERHGLFVIIALGESLIAVGVAANGLERTAALRVVMGLGVVVVGLLWWSYFAWIHETLKASLANANGAAQTTLGRDTYSFIHYLIVFGIIAFAVGLEGAVTHPDQAIETAELALLVSGALLFVVATGAAHLRATRSFLTGRFAIAAAVAVCVWLAADATAAWILAILTTGLIAVVFQEQVLTPNPQSRGTTSPHRS